MPEVHEGIWMRKVLRGKKKINILFMPNDSTQPVLSNIQDYKKEEKVTWEKFLNLKASDHVDIDAGITILRFKTGEASGTASFFPNSEAKSELHREFSRAEGGGGAGVGLAEFNACMEGKRTFAANHGQHFNFVKSFDECLPQMRV